MTLTHSETLDWADSATDEAKHHGLTAFGEQVVREMNRLGMLVDISHVSAETMRHALRVTAPGDRFALLRLCRGRASAQRARRRAAAGKEKRRRGDGQLLSRFHRAGSGSADADMFQIGRDLQKKYPDEREFRAAIRQWRKEHPIPTGSVHHVVDHIEHIIQVAGVDHVGLGSDFDGINTVPKQLEDVSCYPYITQELLNRGYEKEDIVKILGGNLLRVLPQGGGSGKESPEELIAACESYDPTGCRVTDKSSKSDEIAADSESWGVYRFLKKNLRARYNPLLD